MRGRMLSPGWMVTIGLACGAASCADVEPAQGVGRLERAPDADGGSERRGSNVEATDAGAETSLVVSRADAAPEPDPPPKAEATSNEDHLAPGPPLSSEEQEGDVPEPEVPPEPSADESEVEAEGPIEAPSEPSPDAAVRDAGPEPSDEVVEDPEEDPEPEPPVWDFGDEPYPGPCRTTLDRPVDGVLDAETVLTYDADAKLVLTEATHWYGDEVFESRSEFTYDETGLLLRVDSFHEPDLHTWSSYAYDESGRLVHHERDSNGDGAIEYEDDTYYFPDGHYVEHHLVSGNLRVISYDELGNRLLMTFDDANDGVVDDTTTYEYDDQGRLVRSHGSERFPEQTYEYDPTGLEVVETTYRDPPSEKRSIYDEGGNLLRVETNDTSTPANPDWYTVYDYDANGNRLSIETFADGISVDRQDESYECWQ